MTAVDERVETIEHLDFTLPCGGCRADARFVITCRDVDCLPVTYACLLCLELAREQCLGYSRVICSHCVRSSGPSYDSVFKATPLSP